MSKICMVLGATGQDGSFLVDNLISRGMTVVAVVRKAATTNMVNLAHHILEDKGQTNNLIIERGDLLDHARISKLISEYKPDYLFNEADQDHVAWSVDIPSYSLLVTTHAVINIFETIKTYSPLTSVFQPVSSNIFGQAECETQDENTPLNPISPYGIAKAATYNFAKYYRTAYGLKICTGILYNHESHRRTESYLSRKVTKAVANIKKGYQTSLKLGDLNGYVDWGYAPEFMDIVIDLIESQKFDDYVIGTGKLTKVKEFVKIAFDYADLDWEKYVSYDEKLERPIKTSSLCANINKLNNHLGRVPEVDINLLITKMLKHDLEN